MYLVQGIAGLAALIAIAWKEAVPAGALMGTKTVLNKFIAYINPAAAISS